MEGGASSAHADPKAPRFRYFESLDADGSSLRTLQGIFYSHEPNEPPHVHVDRDDATAKFWLESVSLAQNLGFSARELTRIEALVENHRHELLEAWNGYFGT